MKKLLTGILIALAPYCLFAQNADEKEQELLQKKEAQLKSLQKEIDSRMDNLQKKEVDLEMITLSNSQNLKKINKLAQASAETGWA